jgi:alpha-1,3-mannosyl-glycoprotein beta-1,2-N-acetylglucosaminyltransferase
MSFGFESVIITEDDLNIADDFFEYFDSMHKILESDSSLFCVSAWNDNGKKNLIDMSKNGER